MENKKQEIMEEKNGDVARVGQRTRQKQKL